MSLQITDKCKWSEVQTNRLTDDGSDRQILTYYYKLCCNMLVLVLLNELFIIDLTFINIGLKDASDSLTTSSVNASFIVVSTSRISTSVIYKMYM